MSTKRLLLFLVGMTLWIQQTAGQTNIGISTFYWNGPQSVSYGDSSYYSFVVKNYGPNTINTPISLFTGVWDTSMNSIDTIKIDNNTLAQTVLGPGDSVWVNDYTVYDSTNFRVGATVVVIWPAAANATTQNNVSYTIFIESSMNIIEITQPGKASVYPNPASDKVTISPPPDDNETFVEQVRLYDEAGRLILSRRGEGSLDVSGLPAGIYLIEVMQSNGTRTVYRVIKQEH